MSHGIPMSHDEVQKPLPLLLVTQYIVVSYVASPNFREVFAWRNRIGATDQGHKKAVEHLQIHCSLAGKAVKDSYHTIAFCNGERSTRRCHRASPRLLAAPLRGDTSPITPAFMLVINTRGRFVRSRDRLLSFGKSCSRSTCQKTCTDLSWTLALEARRRNSRSIPIPRFEGYMSGPHGDKAERPAARLL